jgi:hypothetical protein
MRIREKIQEVLWKKMDEQTTNEWRFLYEAANEFRSIEPWKWMYDSQLFGVQNPETGEIRYCCIMGTLGEHYALAAYTANGLEAYLMLQYGEYIPPIDHPHIQECLSASFEERKMLGKEDFEVIKKLGLKYRRSNAWPLFRNYTQGYVPWHLNGEDVRELTHILIKAKEIALRIKEDPELLEEGEKDVLVITWEKEGDSGKWVDKWMDYPPYKEKKMRLKADQQLVKKLKDKARRIPLDWEIDFFYAPQGVREGRERPYYPTLLTCIDHESGIVLDTKFGETIEDAPKLVLDLLKTLEKRKILPKTIAVRREDAYDLLEDYAKELDIELLLVEMLPATEEMQEGMIDALTGHFKS